MAITYKLIASSTVGSGGTAYIEFTSISSSYTDLKLVYSLRSDRSASTRDDCKITINSDTGSNYSGKRIYGADGTNTNSQGFTGTPSDQLFVGAIPASSATSNTFGNSEMYFSNYTITANQKSVSSEFSYENNVADNNILGFASMLWNNTANAITSLKIEINSGNNFSQYSTAYLYGIKKD
jgi:hypothetical protein